MLDRHGSYLRKRNTRTQRISKAPRLGPQQPHHEDAEMGFSKSSGDRRIGVKEGVSLKNVHIF